MSNSVFESGVMVRYTALGHEEVTVSTTPEGFPGLPDISRVRRIVIRPMGSGIVFTDDGSTPSASHGMPIMDGEVLVYDGQIPDDFQMVRLASPDADVRVAYYGT